MKIRRSDTILVEIVKAHQRYVDWWLPIDVASGSLLAPMSCHRFCEYLLLYDDEEWWDRWLDNELLTKENKTYDKRIVLGLLYKHTTGFMDINYMTCNLEEYRKLSENNTELR